MAVGPAESDSYRRRVLQLAVLLTGLVTAYGTLARDQVQRVGLDRPRGFNIYFRLFALHELPYQLLLGAFVAGTLVVIARSARGHLGDTLSGDDTGSPRLASLVAVAIAVAIAGLATTRWVMHGLLFSMDEFTVDFQARIFAHGDLAAQVRGRGGRSVPRSRRYS